MPPQPPAGPLALHPIAEHSYFIRQTISRRNKKMPPLCKVRWQPERLTEGLLPSLHETRRNPLAKEDCIIANWLRHRRTTGRRQYDCRQPDAKHPGKTIENSRWESKLSQPAFSLFSLCPWCCFFSFLTFQAKNKRQIRYVHRPPGAGVIPLPRGTGAA